MATTTAYVSCPPGVWTELALGSAFASVGVQSDGPLAVAVGLAAPAADSSNFIVAPGRSVAPLLLPLGTSDKVYGQPILGNIEVGARLYKVTV